MTHEPNQVPPATHLRLFKDIIDCLEARNVPLIDFERLQTDYSIEAYKLNSLDRDKVTQMFNIISLKQLPQSFAKTCCVFIFRYDARPAQGVQYREWFENELRIFLWILFHYSVLVQANILQFGEEQWVVLSQVFMGKSVSQLKFEYLTIMKSNPLCSTEWTFEEDKLILEIYLRLKANKNVWNQSAKQLFRVSNEQYFKKPKQCRERITNRLARNLETGYWKREQDCFILRTVLEKGKRWAFMAKELEFRNEHSVKNRYRSILNKYSKSNSATKIQLSPAKELEVVQTILSLWEKSAPKKQQPSDSAANLQEKPVDRPQCRSIMQDLDVGTLLASTERWDGSIDKGETVSKLSTRLFLLSSQEFEDQPPNRNK